jgi:tetrapyrrole methylase family protein/MazG family protein
LAENWESLKKEVLKEYNSVDPIQAFQRLYQIIKILRSPIGCNWDRGLNYKDLQQNIVEESFELIDGIHNGSKSEMREELGDVFLVITMLGRILEEESMFTLSDSLHEVCEKLIRRHPHVFSKSNNLSADAIKKQWEEIKKQEKDPRDINGFLYKIGHGLHPLDKAANIQKKVSKIGFDWPDSEGVILKIEEEIEEVKVELKRNNQEKLQMELGDLLFSVINLIRYLGYSPTLLLERNLNKFALRFEFLENKMKENGLALSPDNFDRMEYFWQKSKHLNELFE